MLLRKIVYLALSLCLLCLMFCGCAIKAPNEEVIKESLERNGSIELGQQCFSVNQVTIELQRTDDNYDYAECIIDLSNETCATQVRYGVEHTYYDKGGWVLSDFEKLSDYQIIPLTGVPKEEWEDTWYICSQLDLDEEKCKLELLEETCDLNTGWHTAKFKCYRTEEYCTLESEIAVAYEFNSWTGTWSLSDVSTSEWTYNWNLDKLKGIKYKVDVDWSYDLYVTINDFNSDSVELSYECNYCSLDRWEYKDLTLNAWNWVVEEKDDDAYYDRLNGCPVIWFDEFTIDSSPDKYSYIRVKEDIRLLIAPDGLYYYEPVYSERYELGEKME